MPCVVMRPDNDALTWQIWLHSTGCNQQGHVGSKTAPTKSSSSELEVPAHVMVVMVAAAT